MTILPASKAGPHCGVRIARKARSAPPILPASKAGPHCGAYPDRETFQASAILPASKAGPHCGTPQSVLQSLHQRILPASKAGPHCGANDPLNPSGSPPILPASKAGPHCGLPPNNVIQGIVIEFSLPPRQGPIAATTGRTRSSRRRTYSPCLQGRAPLRCHLLRLRGVHHDRFSLLPRQGPIATSGPRLSLVGLGLLSTSTSCWGRRWPRLSEPDGGLRPHIGASTGETGRD